MPTRHDWLFIIGWTALFAAAIVAVVALFWLVQQAFLAVWPFVSAHGDTLLAVLATGTLFAAVVAAVREERG
jgi:hypothetical protein